MKLFDIEKLKNQIFSIQDQIVAVNTTATNALSTANLAINTITNNIAFVKPFISTNPSISIATQTITLPTLFGHGDVTNPALIDFTFQVGSKLTYYHVLDASDPSLDESEVVNFTTLRRFLYGAGGSSGALGTALPNTGGTGTGNYTFQGGTVTITSNLSLSGSATLSTAPLTGIDLTNKTYVDSQISSVSASIPSLVSTAILSYGYAPLASPTFTGTPAAPTPSLSDNSTTIPTTAWVKGQNYLSGSGVAPVISLVDGTSIPIDATTNSSFALRITVSSLSVKTLQAPTGISNGQKIQILITHTDNITALLKYDPIYEFIDGSGGLLTKQGGTSNTISDLLIGVYDSSTSKIYCKMYNNFKEQRTSAYKKDFTVQTASGTTDGFRTVAKFSSPFGICANLVDNGIVIADKNNHTIRQIRQIDETINNSQSSTIVGTAGTPGSTGTLLNTPISLINTRAITPAGFYILQGDFTIVKWDNTSTLTRMAGTPGVSGTSDGTGTSAQFTNLKDGVSDSTGNLFVIDGNAIRKMNNTGTVSTFAGNVVTSGNTDGTGTGATFNNPKSITIDASDNLYVVETNGSNNQIRMITPAGVTSTLASIGAISIQSIRIDNYNDIYMLSSGNGNLYKFNITNLSTTQLTTNYNHESEISIYPHIEQFSLLRNDLDYSTYNVNVSAASMFIDSNNLFYISDSGNNKILIAGLI